MKKLSFLVAMAAVAVFVFAASLPASGAGNARVRVIHASPDAPNVDVYANGQRVLSNVPFNTVSAYLTVPEGTYRFQVTPAGGSLSAPVIDATADLVGGKDYSVVALDRVSQLKYRVFEDNNAAPASGQAHINVIHASPNAPNVDIAARGAGVLVPDLGFGDKAGPLPVPAGTYDLEVRVAGTTTVALPVNGVALQSGKVYTFIATGLAGGTPPLGILAASVDGTPASTSGGTNVAPPRAGDGGLIGESSGTPAWAALVAIFMVVSAGGMALAYRRTR